MDVWRRRKKTKKSWSFQTLAGSKPDLAVHYKNLAVHYKTLAGSKPALAGSNPTLAGERFRGWLNKNDTDIYKYF